MRTTSGFTLIELSYVLALIALLAAFTVPAYDSVYRRAHVAEVRAMIHAIAHAELRQQRDRGGYVPCGPFGDVPTDPVAFPVEQPCWKLLGIAPEGPVRYRYGVVIQDDTFVVTAEGDLDGDGVLSTFVLDGRDLVIVGTNDLE
jgi:prepilin-type N-terminal cleavage/methylation domain-containing protein